MLIKNGTVVTENESRRCDLRIEGERITAMGNLDPIDGEEVLDAGGLLVLPGLIDPHLHIRLDTGIYSTPDDWEIGTREAALGGVTTVLDFATQFPGQSWEQALEARQAEIRGKAIVDYGLHMMVTDRRAAGSFEEMAAAGVDAVKVYTTYRPNYYQDDAALLEIMGRAAKAGLPIMLHAENDAIVTEATERLLAGGDRALRFHGRARPEFAEVEAAHRACFLAAEAGCVLYIVHNSSPRTVDVIEAARRSGQVIWSETCPQYLTLDESVYETSDAWRFILQPPLRSRTAVEGLWERVLRGTVDCLGTDHCDYSIEQKRAADDFSKTPGGLPGLETLLVLTYDEGVVKRGLKMERLVALCCANPARAFGLYPRKGTIAVGSDADIVFFDPEQEWVIRADERVGTARYNPWEGRKVRGRVRRVFSRGEEIVSEGECRAEPGRGRFCGKL
ncbi:MAG: dihydropyrimidinase [Candidatus Hydrogenedentota bacterium]|nr:MAG: dihydropyrimidinase [Candidatus Hydrogenedentota bacterium]